MFSNVLYSVFKVQSWYFSVSMGLSGLEPPTSRLSGVRSNRLSYKPLGKNDVFSAPNIFIFWKMWVLAARFFLIFSWAFQHLHVSMLRGDGEIRTLDPLLARQVLSQLSYTPIGIRQPPTFPCRLQHSIIGRLSLNHRVRDENGCVP